MGQCYSTTSVIVSKKIEDARGYISSQRNRRYIQVSQDEIEKEIDVVLKDDDI